MKFTGKTLVIIILKFTKKEKKQGFTLSLENTFLEKPHGWGRGEKWTSSLFRVRMLISFTLIISIITS